MNSVPDRPSHPSADPARSWPALSLQLYTIRDALAIDRPAALARVRGLGVIEVESFRLGIGDDAVAAATALRRDLDAAGLTVAWSHAPAPMGEQTAVVLDAAEALGVSTLVVASPGAVPGFSHDTFTDADATRRLGDALSEAAGNAAERGLRLAYHNHYREFTQLADETAYEVLLAASDPSVLIELDVYWAQAGGADPADLARRLGSRLRSLHLKDGPAVPNVDQLPIGQGVVDNVAVAAVAAQAELHVLEIDRCAGDVWKVLGAGAAWWRQHQGALA